MHSNIAKPVVLGGPATWAPAGEVRWDRWGGTAPSWDQTRNVGNPNAVVWPLHREEVARAVAKAAMDGWANNGPRELELRHYLTKRRGVPTVTVANGSDALRVALGAVIAKRRLHGNPVPAGAEVLTTGTSFNATPMMCADVRLTPIMVDPEPDTLVPSVAALEAAVNERVVGFLIPPMYAASVDLAALRLVADRHGLFIVVDGAHAPFGLWDGRSFAHWADIVTTSYQYGKVATGGEEGDVYTLDAELAALADMGRNVGVRPEGMPESLRDFFVQGRNLRTDEFRAAALLVQLGHYDEQQAHRLEQYNQFLTALAGSGLPFTPLRRTGDEILYKLGIYNGTRIPTGALRRIIARQTTGEVNAPYAPLCEPKASGWNPASEPLTYDGLRLQSGVHFPNAHRAADGLLMVAHDFLLRRDAAQHLIEALEVAVAHERELAVWAETAAARRA